MKIAGDDVGADVVLRVAPDVPGSRGELAFVIVEFQVVVDVVRKVGGGGSGFEGTSAAEGCVKGLVGENLRPPCRHQKHEKQRGHETPHSGPLLPQETHDDNRRLRGEKAPWFAAGFGSRAGWLGAL
jgi:hypothetical protein